MILLAGVLFVNIVMFIVMISRFNELKKNVYNLSNYIENLMDDNFKNFYNRFNIAQAHLEVLIKDRAYILETIDQISKPEKKKPGRKKTRNK